MNGFEVADGFSTRREYDHGGNLIYEGQSLSYRDENGEQFYFEIYWEKFRYDENGEMVYSEDSLGNVWMKDDIWRK